MFPGDDFGLIIVYTFISTIQMENTMKLSMSMLAWYMKNYRPCCSIHNDALVIQGVRFLVDETRQLQEEYIYVSHAEIWFSDPQYAGAYLVAHGKSTMFFWNCDYDELLNTLLSAFDYFNTWESRLLEAASRQAALQELLDIAAEVLSNPSAIHGSGSTILATADTSVKRDDPYWQLCMETKKVHPAITQDLYFDDQGNMIHDLSEQPKLVQNVFPGGAPVMMSYLKQGEDVLGCLCILQEDKALTAMNEQMVPFLNRFFVKAREFSLPSGAVRSAAAIIRDMLDGHEAGDENMRYLARQLPCAPWQVVIFCHVARMDMLAKKTLLNKLQERTEILAPFIYRDGVVGLVQEKNSVFIQGETRSSCHAGYCVCMSMSFRELSDIPLRYKQAVFALAQSGHKAGVWRCEDFAFDYMLTMLSEQEMTPLLLHPSLEQLRHYDRSNQCDLWQTLSVYLMNEQNQAAAANALHIHVNTLKYRLRRIREITGLTLEDIQELNYLRLSNWLDVRIGRRK